MTSAAPLGKNVLELNHARMLRFRYEEIDRLKDEWRPKVEAGVDWLLVAVQNHYPNWHVQTTLNDYRGEYVYVMLVREPICTMIESWIDEHGEIHVEETLL